MARYSAWALAALLVLPVYSRTAEGCGRGRGPQQQRGSSDQQKAGRSDQGHSPRKWWIDADLRSQLGITDQQSTLVDQIWQKSVPPLRDAHARLDKLEAALSAMTESADESAVIAEIDKVETTRAELNKGRTLMLYRMNKVLTPEQRAKVKALFDHRDGGRRESSR